MEAMKALILPGIEEGLEMQVMEEKRRSVFATKRFSRRQFICQYPGELISRKAGQAKEREYAKYPEDGWIFKTWPINQL